MNPNAITKEINRHLKSFSAMLGAGGLVSFIALPNGTNDALLVETDSVTYSPTPRASVDLSVLDPADLNDPEIEMAMASELSTLIREDIIDAIATAIPPTNAAVYQFGADGLAELMFQQAKLIAVRSRRGTANVIHTCPAIASILMSSKYYFNCKGKSTIHNPAEGIQPITIMGDPFATSGLTILAYRGQQEHDAAVFISPIVVTVGTDSIAAEYDIVFPESTNRLTSPADYIVTMDIDYSNFSF